MQITYNMSNEMFYQAKKVRKREQTIRFKSRKAKVDPKTKELITKYRKGLIWKDI